MSMSRPNRMSSPCSPSTPITTDTNDVDPDTLTKQPPFPRFLVVQCTDHQKKLRDQNFDITDRTIRGVTSASVIIQWMGPALLVEVSYEAYAHNLLKLTQIGELPVKVAPHRSMNSRKGVVKFGRAANGMSNEEVKDALNSSPRNRDMPFVAEAFRVSVNRNNDKRPTGTFYLTFQGNSLPQKVRLGFERFDFDFYIPFPRRCFKCQSMATTPGPVRPLQMSAQCAKVQVTNKTVVHYVVYYALIIVGLGRHMDDATRMLYIDVYCQIIVWCFCIPWQEINVSQLWCKLLWIHSGIIIRWHL